MTISVKRVIAVLLALGFSWACIYEARSAEPLRVLYTDIESGPITGGEDNLGTYLSIFGTGFGATQGASTVEINGQPVGAYKYWGASNGRADIQQITVQPGGSITTGGIEVIVGGISSNTDLTFTPAAGDIYFVSQSGDNGTGVAGNIALPFRDCQETVDLAAYGPGDTIVMRAGTWTDNGPDDPFCLLKSMEGTAGLPLMILAYPGEAVIIANDDNGFKLRYQPPDFPVEYVTIAGFEIDTDSSAIAFSNWTRYLRIVNNNAHGLSKTGSGTGNIGGHTQFSAILGNHVWDIGENKLYHNIYLSNGDNRPVGDNEVAWNNIHHNRKGRGIQHYHGGATNLMVNQDVHDNIIHDIDDQHAISMGNTTGTGFEIYNNVIYDVHAGIRPNSNDGLTVDIYNNTIYNPENVCYDFDLCTSINLKNNICYAPGITANYFYLDDLCPSGVVTASHNLYFGAGAAPAWDSTSVLNVDPQFEDIPNDDFRTTQASPVTDSGDTVASVTTDHLGIPRPQNSVYDRGAYEWIDGVVIENPVNCYADDDGDTYGDPGDVVVDADGTCDAPRVEDNTDCDDAAAAINPGASEVVGDLVDENCDGVLGVNCYPDVDDDTFGDDAAAPTAETDGVCAVASVGGTLGFFDFASDEEGWTYVDDAFLGTAEPDYADGFWASEAAKVVSGELVVQLGNVDGTSVTNMSGAWIYTLVLASQEDITLTFDYQMLFEEAGAGSGYEADECAQVLVTVAGIFYGTGKESYLVEVCGDGATDFDTGEQPVSIPFTLTAGSHFIVLGGYNNGKTSSGEQTTIMFDNVNFGTPDGGTPAYVTDNTDCDDTDAAVNPSVAEIPGNGIDDDCDTVIDTGIPCYPDADLDTYGDTSSPTSDPDGVCDAPLISDGTDCDDTDALINPGAYDVAGDAIDQDCNGIDAIFCYPDADLDGYGNVISTPTTDADGSCDVGFANNNTDCDDQRNDINPGQPDPSQDGIDQDCDGGDGPEGIYVKPHPPDAAPIVSVNPALSGEGGNASFFLYGVLR